nr:MaoC family dehydratase [Mongoliibacter sp.]
MEKSESPVKSIRSIEDLKKLEGSSLGKSSWLKVSQDLIQKFAETTQDLQWIHIDTEKAKTLLPGGKNLAHGYLTLSLIPKLMYELLPLDQVEMALNYGTDKVRFPAPLYSGDQVQLKASVQKVETNADGSAKIFLLAEMYSAHSDKPVCVAEMISLVRM